MIVLELSGLEPEGIGMLRAEGFVEDQYQNNVVKY
jgi:hypothetical protein